MWIGDLFGQVARFCDACTRESLAEAVHMKFPPQKLRPERLVTLHVPQILYDSRSHTYYTYYGRRDHNLHVKITRYPQWTAYDYMFEKYCGDQLIYCSNYWTDPDNNIVVQQHTFCRSTDADCGCILCQKHLQVNKHHLIAELVTPCHDWHTLKLTRCPRRFISFKRNRKQLLKCRVF